MDKATEPSVTQTLGAHGACPTITHGDKTWTVGHPTQKAKAELELLVIAYAKENVERVKDVDAELYAQERATLSKMIRMGSYQTWGELWQEAWNGPDRFPLLLASTIRAMQEKKDFTVAQAKAIWVEQTEDVIDTLAVVLPDFFTRLLEGTPGTAAMRAVEQVGMLAEIVGSLQKMKALLAPTTTESSTSSTS